MIDETTNPVDAGSDNVEPSSALDNPANLDFVEHDVPEEELTANPEAEAEGTETEREPDDTREGEEAAESEPETEESAEAAEPEEGEAEEAPGDVLVTLPSGDQVQLDELKSGYMRDKDYRHKTTEVANTRRELEATAKRVNGTIEAFSSYLASQLPEKPPAALAYSDPTAFTQQQAVYDAAMQQVNAIIQMGQQSSDAVKQLTEEEHASVVREENARLLEKLPALADKAKREEFNQKTFETAQKLGFTAEELNRTTDHRILVLGHYARLGLEAEQAKAKAALKAKKAPPVAPAAKRSKAVDGKVEAQKAAIKRLNKTGSMQDAMAIDFE